VTRGFSSTGRRRRRVKPGAVPAGRRGPRIKVRTATAPPARPRPPGSEQFRRIQTMAHKVPAVFQAFLTPGVLNQNSAHGLGRSDGAPELVATSFGPYQNLPRNVSRHEGICVVPLWAVALPTVVPQVWRPLLRELRS
jgi:hypothetical protein